MSSSEDTSPRSGFRSFFFALCAGSLVITIVAILGDKMKAIYMGIAGIAIGLVGTIVTSRSDTEDGPSLKTFDPF